VATERPYRTAHAGWDLAHGLSVLPAARNEILHGAEKSGIGSRMEWSVVHRRYCRWGFVEPCMLSVPAIPHDALDAAFVGI
jgi:hypothetical protein